MPEQRWQAQITFTLNPRIVIQIIGALAALIAGIGILAPWVTAQAPFAHFSLSGTHYGEMAAELAGAVVLAVIGFIAGGRVFPLIGSLLLVGEAAYALTQMLDRVSSVNDKLSNYGSADVGWGMWLIVAMAAISLSAALALLTAPRGRREPSPES